MTLATVRRLAADILNIGKRRVRFSTDGLKEAEGALTRSDVKGLIDKGLVKKINVQGRDSTARKKRRGKGRKKGSLGDRKKLWMQKVRSQRKLLVILIESGTLAKEHKRSIYGKVKGGIFKSKRAMLLYLKDNELIAKDYEIPKKEMPPKKEVKKTPAKKAPEKKESKKEGEQK